MTPPSPDASDLPALVALHGRAALLTADGELICFPIAEAGRHLAGSTPPLLVHAPATWRRLGLHPGPALDLLELFAFVHPARAAAPTPAGIAIALDLDPPDGLEAAAAALPCFAAALLRRLAAGRDLPANRDAGPLAARMGAAGWGWAPSVAAALGGTAPSAEAYKLWRRLPEWEEVAPTPPGASFPVTPAESRARLARLLGPGAEQRPGQADYAGAATAAFAPRERPGDPAFVLAEAGTGTGKTLGYVAPASLWAERNGQAVWISTYTRHLQRQIDAELRRLLPDPVERRRRVVVRKGRENYLCLLNYEDQVQAALGGLGAAALTPLGLVARWGAATVDGDLQGGDLPGWLGELFGAGLTPGLADRRGECLHAACPHHRRCFVEHTIRRARAADLVVANHALVMAQAGWGGLDDDHVPPRYVFDEGHHLFDAADGAFSAELSGRKGAELRRWLLGAEGGRSRARGLRRRLEDLVAGRDRLAALLEAGLAAARALPAPFWPARLAKPDDAPEAAPNPFERLLRLLRRQVLARQAQPVEPDAAPPAFAVGLECDLYPVLPELPEAALGLDRALARLEAPFAALRAGLAARLEDEAEELDAAIRNRIEAACRSLQRRVIDPARAWRQMLGAVAAPTPEPGARPEHILFLKLDRHPAGDRDAGLLRHPLDPTAPFVASLAAPAHGILVTSATLRDASASSGGNDADAMEAAWTAAEARVGAAHLPSPAIRVAVASPFDYAAQTRCLVVTDVAPEIGPLAAAYRTLFRAAGGGGLGLFTAIGRLRAVHARIAPALEADGITLLGQHVDPMDNATLVDVFRAEPDSCLLGTDAMRDGVDVPGRALRLVVFERVPWPRPDILHRERRIHLSGGDARGYDDRIARFRLRQAFGRLIRAERDRGVFVLLDRRMPGRLGSAFPPGVTVRRVGLAEAAAETAGFVGGG